MTYEIKEYGSCYELVKITNNNYEVIIANIWFGSEFNEDMIPKSKAYEIIKEIKNHLELNNKRENEINYLESIKPSSNSKRKYGVTKKDNERWRNQLFNKHIK